MKDEGRRKQWTVDSGQLYNMIQRSKTRFLRQHFSKKTMILVRKRVFWVSSIVNKPGVQRSNVSPQASYFPFSRAFYSEVVPPPLTNTIPEYF